MRIEALTKGIVLALRGEMEWSEILAVPTGLELECYWVFGRERDSLLVSYHLFKLAVAFSRNRIFELKTCDVGHVLG